MHQPSAAQRAPNLAELWRLFLPLSFSDIIMVLSGPLLTAGLTRLANYQANLAAYSVAEAVAIVIESPVIMLIHAAAALGRSPSAYRALRRYMYILCLLLTAVHVAVAYTPLYDLVFAGWLHQPPAVVTAARGAARVMILWTAAIGWRRFYQGLLVTYQQNRPILWAAYGRLAAVALTVGIGVLLRLDGALVAGLALQNSVLVEGVLITIIARPFERRALAASEPPELADSPRTLAAVNTWYAPLMVTALLAWSARLVFNAGMARAPEAELSLAAWPVVWTTAVLLANGTRSVQMLAISTVRDAASYLALRRFALALSAGAVALMAVVTFTPLAPLYLGGVLGVTGDLARVTLPGLHFMVLLPALVCWQNMLQGLLIAGNRTRWVNGAAIGGSIAVIGLVFGGAAAGRWTGLTVSAIASQLSLLVELGFLWLATRSARHLLTQAA